MIEIKGLRLIKKLSDVKIKGDEKRLFQAISNLVDNAVNYTEKGKIEIILKDGKDHCRIELGDGHFNHESCGSRFCSGY